jgi:hypothetical protein
MRRSSWLIQRMPVLWPPLSSEPREPDKEIAMSSGADKIDKERRDLYAVSLVIIMYLAAGASLRDDVSTFLGAFRVARPWVILLGLGALWGYFLWRYLLAIGNLRDELLDDCDSRIYRSRLFAMHCAQVERSRIARLQALAEQADEVRKQNRLLDKARAIETFLRDNTHFVFQPEQRSMLRKYRFGYPAAKSGAPLDFILTSEADEYFSHVGLKPSLRWRIVLWAWLMAALSERTFSDKVLPVVVAAAAGLCGLWVLLRWLISGAPN